MDLAERAFQHELAEAQRRALMAPHGLKIKRERRLRRLRTDQLRREVISVDGARRTARK